MKKIILLFVLIAVVSSCTVQQFPVNTNTEPFSKGGEVFGEKTKGEAFIKQRDFFVIGISVSHSDTQKMAQELKATSYMIETKSNFFSFLLQGITFGIVSYRVVKVIKCAS